MLHYRSFGGRQEEDYWELVEKSEGSELLVTCSGMDIMVEYKLSP